MIMWKNFHLSTISYQISSLIIPNSVTSIGSNAFDGNQTSSLTFAENSNLITIGDRAFYSNQISSLTLPDSVTTIGDCAFYSNQISSLTIPKSVTSIGDIAFSGNPLTSILIKRTKEDFEANVTVGTNWYRTSNNPTITYEP